MLIFNIKQVNLEYILRRSKQNWYTKNQIFSNFSYLILNYIRFSFKMLVFNIKQVNLEYILRRTKQNLKHATAIQTNNEYTLTEPNLA